MTHGGDAGRAARVLYLYGLASHGFDATGAPPGLDDADVTTIDAGPVTAIVSRLPSDDYAADAVERRSGDVGWLGARATAHDRVLSWAQHRAPRGGSVIPSAMFSLWGTERALMDSLGERQDELVRLLDRLAGADEFGLRLHRRDAIMRQSVGELDSDIADLRRSAASASPGQRYLLERKMAEREKTAVRAASQRIAKRVFDALRDLARDAVSRPLVPDAGPAPEVTLVLNAAFLVERTRLQDFRAAVTAHAREYEPRGMVFDFTGPWPPYNFSR